MIEKRVKVRLLASTISCIIAYQLNFALSVTKKLVRVWREHRGMIRKQLAESSGLSVPYLSQIETGKRKGSPEALAAIAKELGLSPDDIVDS